MTSAPTSSPVYEVRGTGRIVRPVALAAGIGLLAIVYVASVMTSARTVPVAGVVIAVIVVAVFGGWRDVVLISLLALATAVLVTVEQGLWGTADMAWRLVLVLGVSISAGLLAWARDRRLLEGVTAARRLRAIVDGAGVGLAVLRTDGTIELASERLASLLGIASDELRGRRFDTLVVSVEAQGRPEAAAVRITDGAAEFLAIAYGSEGQEIPVRCTARYFSGHGVDEGSLVVVADIREELRLQEEDQRERAADEHRQRLELVGQLAGGLAHDFNNLLAAAQMAVQLTADSVHEPELVEMLGVAATSIQHAGGVTRQLLTLSRRDPATPEPLALADVFDRIGPLLRTAIGRSVTVAVEVDEATPLVLIDPTQLEQVLLNLSTNARDAMPDGGVVTFRVAPTEDGAGVRIQVSDTGIGMDAETAARAFQPFFTTKARRTGTGLGLAMVEQIVLRARGVVDLSSEPGVGTTISITLPAVGAGVDRHADAAALPTEAHSSDQVFGTVLVVDDHADLARLTGVLLRRAGYDVLVATSAQEALELAATPPRIDLVLSDVVMPEMDGIALAAQIRAAHPTTPVLFMSGYTADHFGDAGPERGIDLLVKPFAADALLAAVAARVQR